MADKDAISQAIVIAVIRHPDNNILTINVSELAVYSA